MAIVESDDKDENYDASTNDTVDVYSLPRTSADNPRGQSHTDTTSSTVAVPKQTADKNPGVNPTVDREMDAAKNP